MGVSKQMIRMMSDGEVAKALKNVLERVTTAAKARKQDLVLLCEEPRLVAVSKTKPKEMIEEAYAAGQRHFGENYVQELVQKAHDLELQEKCPEIKWHVIGHIQSNKINKVVGIPNLYMVETVDTPKLANAINRAWAKQNKDTKLKVLVQVNTSSEENKSGIQPSEAGSLFNHIITQCPNLEAAGLMTIGAFDHDLSIGPNPDMECLLKCRAQICEDMSLDPKNVELSMGMSNDFEHAIGIGSTNVRVGSTIFGARNIQKS
ncbi:pyridoxal phosphate homeostasis protein [Oratosquilla oratoria]|uniref:pyridoxal phosphate homeostasis protein n=1 Tax=Oratosquilla oratoria TaxID=337810 RepID=UPI003F77180A